MRLFIALSLPALIRARLAELEHGLPGARWVVPENLHLSLRFIGEVDGRQAHDIDAALAQVRASCFSLGLSGVGRFGQGRKSRALWVGTDPNPDLDRLYLKIEQAVRSAGLPAEGRKFKPHVTLARFKSDPGHRLHEYLARNALFRAEAFEARDFILYSSFLSHNGAIYSPEAVYPLSPAVRAAG